MGIAETYRGPSGNLLPGLRMDLEEAIKKLKKLFREKSVPIAYLFGSYICGEVGAASDVDIAVFLILKRKAKSSIRLSRKSCSGFEKPWARSVSILCFLTVPLCRSSLKLFLRDASFTPRVMSF